MLALVRLLLASLALLGFYVPGNRLYDCPDHKPPTNGPQGCQVVRVNPAIRQQAGIYALIAGNRRFRIAGIRPVVQNAAP